MTDRRREGLLIHTIGHSTRTTEELLHVLAGFAVQCLVDIRRFPSSRRHPHFSKEVLDRDARAGGIAYQHLEALGGYRKPASDSPNAYWTNAGFRGYADHMRTDAFAGALRELIELARRQSVAVMCAEAVPWRCHRNLLADALVGNGVEVRHILALGRAQQHELNPAAIVDANGGVTYPAASGQMKLL